jgi:hypothetical protein
MGNYTEVMKAIVSERERIWMNEPSEVDSLRRMQKGRGGNATSKLYALYDGYRNQRNLWQFRNIVKDNDLGLEVTKKILLPFVQEMVDRFKIWDLQTPQRLFGDAANALESIETTEEMVNLLDELLLFNNRLWLWIDSTIPWFQLDDLLSS